MYTNQRHACWFGSVASQGVVTGSCHLLGDRRVAKRATLCLVSIVLLLPLQLQAPFAPSYDIAVETRHSAEHVEDPEYLLVTSNLSQEDLQATTNACDQFAFRSLVPLDTL